MWAIRIREKNAQRTGKNETIWQLQQRETNESKSETHGKNTSQQRNTHTEMKRNHFHECEEYEAQLKTIWQLQETNNTHQNQ